MFKIADNILVNFIDYDDGKPIVLLHDWGQNLEDMDHIARKLNDSRKILLDFPGFGESEEPIKSYNIDDYTHVLRCLLLELNVVNPIIIANSFGGKVALKYASKYGAEKLILISTLCNKNVKDQTFKDKIINYIKDKYVTLKEYKDMSPVMKETLIRVNKDDLIEDVNRINIPTLIINGNKDEKVPLESAEELESQIKNSVLIELDGSHDICEKYQSEIANILNKYFDGYKIRKRIK